MTRLLPALLTLALPGFGLTGCAGPAAPEPASTRTPADLGADVLWPSPRIIVGRLVAWDEARGFAFVELQADAPSEASRPDAELLVRAADLTPGATLRASPHLRGRLLGCRIIAGRPGVGTEVVWLPP